MDINRKAPVIAAGEIEVAADADTIWSIMTAIDRWPDWNPAVRSASLDGELLSGAKFRWKSSHATIVSTLQHVKRPKLLVWTGETFGIAAIHIFRLEQKDGKTVVTTEESWNGLLSWIFRVSMKNMLQKSIVDGLRYLKGEAERRSKKIEREEAPLGAQRRGGFLL
jgi:hypothetical protein